MIHHSHQHRGLSLYDGARGRRSLDIAKDEGIIIGGKKQVNVGGIVYTIFFLLLELAVAIDF
ncbi:hypothetical protein L873DRAFT_1081735 [Choiromyces venosus 120613-1]|uniref:Uncharacterized protein n=1 Tax=Choiromyces venosus 120613-1 TaxID=1336337 RepID=A0A3N4JLU3_9PEZI|nr:hypothetical protein L873DRAFT_1081735 [Choiromyces venosus 120613-1]